jgi:hypothetical protein
MNAKILDALGCALTNISEERLLDILLDAYESKKKQISELQAANAREREDLHHQRELMAEEYRRMRQDPLYGAGGQYYFANPGRGARFCVTVHGRRIILTEQGPNSEVYMRPISQEEYNHGR